MVQWMILLKIRYRCGKVYISKNAEFTSNTLDHTGFSNIYNLNVTAKYKIVTLKRIIVIGTNKVIFRDNSYCIKNEVFH